jgi:fructose-1,6-bisphosphatase I
VNEAYASRWEPEVREFVDHLKGGAGTGHPGSISSRYIGSLVADFHRTLLRGGIFLYPADRKSPEGKLRLLYEAAPLAHIAEAAGGRASDGRRDILDVCPRSLHQRTPLFIGSADLVSRAEAYIGGAGRVEKG